MRTRRSQSSSDPVSRNKGHRSVLLQEVIEALDITQSDIVVDATLGGAGHARAMADKLGPNGILIGLDADSDAVERARQRLADAKSRVLLVPANFRDLKKVLADLGVGKITKVLFDLGWSSYQLDSGRGFSFSARGGSALGGQKDELLMTYRKNPQSNDLTAATIVNTWSEQSIADVIFGWGQERYARRIAKAIVARRGQKSFETSRELAETIKAAVPPPYRFGRIHPATKTFQALRIAVNDELGALKEGISSGWERLAAGGRIAVITFHSIEDREVKRLFVAFARQGGRLLSKKPIRPGPEEIKENPRARSAKLRVIEKTI